MLPRYRLPKRPRSRTAVALALLVIVLATAMACGGGGAASGHTAPETPTRAAPTPVPPTPSPTPLPASPTPPPLADRATCDEVRGTSYRSETERQWFLASCITPTPTLAAVAQPVIAPPNATAAPGTTPPSCVLGVGDSVMLGAARNLSQAIEGLVLKVEIGVQAAVATELVRQLKESGSLCPTVFFQLGNNGAFTVAEFEALMSLLADVERVLVVNLSEPRDWEEPNNVMLASNVGRYPNARLLDWHALAASHAEYFEEDSIHLRPEGAVGYANLIIAALQ